MAVITTKAIVLSAIKYSDSSLIVKCYTYQEGLKSYLVRGVLKAKKGGLKAAYFQPLTQLNIVAKHSAKGALNTIKEVQVAQPYNTIYKDIVKQSVVLFLSEVLSYAIKEEEKNFALFNFLKNSIIWLDQSNKFSNFHIHFLIKLLSFMGIYPDLSNQNLNSFNMIDGVFCKYDRTEYCVTGEIVSNFKSFLGTEFDDSVDEVNTSVKRKKLIEFLIKYMQIHLPDFKRPTSLNILYELFG